MHNPERYLVTLNGIVKEFPRPNTAQAVTTVLTDAGLPKDSATNLTRLVLQADRREIREQGFAIVNTSALNSMFNASCRRHYFTRQDVAKAAERWSLLLGTHLELDEFLLNSCYETDEEEDA